MNQSDSHRCTVVGHPYPLGGHFMCSLEVVGLFAGEGGA